MTAATVSEARRRGDIVPRCVLLGTGRYTEPLGATAEKKFRALSDVAGLFVLGFGPGMRPRRFQRHAHFFLMPEFPVPVARYATFFLSAVLLLPWLVLRHRVGIIVAQSPFEAFPGWIVKSAMGLFGRRVSLVVEAHGDFERDLFLQRRVRPARLYRWVMRRVARTVFRGADVVRTISSSTERQVRRWAPDPPMIRFPTWTDIDVFLAMGASAVVRRDPVLLYVGVLIPRKGVHLLLEAFAKARRRNPEARLVIVGSSQENPEYAEMLRDQAQAMGGSVEFHGPVAADQLAREMARARSLVLPSSSEGLGRVIFEAMACGTPAIATRVGGMPDMVHDGETGLLVPADDQDALVSAVERALLHGDDMARMGANAREFARRFFSTDRYVAGYAEIFRLAGAATLNRRAGA